MATYVDFQDGTSQRARVTFTNPKAQAISYGGRFYLANPADLNTPVNTPITKAFTVAAQGNLAVDYDIGIPLLTVQQAQFVACLQVTVGGTPIVTFVGTEIVRVTFSPAVQWGDIIWNP